MDTSRQRVLKRTPARKPKASTPRPSPMAVAAAYIEVARERVAVGVEELEAAVAARLGLDPEDDLLDEVGHELMYDGPVAILASDVVVHVPTLMAGAVLTHRLTDDERAEDFLLLDTDLAAFRRIAEPVVNGDPLDVDDADGTVAWLGPEGWLAGFPADALVGVTVDAGGVVDVQRIDGTPPTPPGLVARLRAVYDAELAEPGLPVPAEALLLGLRHHDRTVLTAAAPPLDELAAAAGLERRDDEFGHAESVWAAAAEADRHWRLLARLGPGGAATTALEVLDLMEDAEPDAHALRRALDLAQDPDVVWAVTEELLGELDDPAALAAFVALADRMVSAAGTSPRAAVARWMAAVAAERDGRVLDAQAHLRAACSEAEGWPFVEDRLAWFEADRGDAAAALMRWRAIGVPDDDEDLAMVRRFAGASTGPAPGRNDPCPCGSGRKYKQCHLGRPAAPPLPERVGWLWRKAAAYLERRGGAAEAAMGWSAEARAVEDGDVDAAYGDPLTVDVTLHEEGWFARFLRERGPLLPEDEALLGASWLLVDRTVYEVLAVDPGAGMDLRDLRTGDRVAVTERTASHTVTAGMLLCARAVPDGSGHQLVGGVLPVPPGRERGLLEVLDEGSGALLLEWAAARSAPPRLLGPDGADPLDCTARVAVGADAADILDIAYAPAGDGWVRLDADDHVLAVLALDGDVLTVRTLSAPRLDAVLADLAIELPEGRVLSDERVPVEPGTEPPSERPTPLDPSDLVEIQDRYERRWCDEHVPALDGHTPREAAADPTRRDELIRLIDGFPEIDPATGAFGLRPWRLRELLGLA